MVGFKAPAADYLVTEQE